MEHWARQVNNEVENVTESWWNEETEHWKKQSIYRVPHHVKDACEKAYTPQKVSIGPYHHGEEQVKGMEEHKHRALLHFLKRSKKPLESYVDALAPVMEDAMDAYTELDRDNWRNDPGAFLKLMIVDGCFLLEVMRAATARGPPDRSYKQMGYAENDPVFGYLLNHLRGDILMLENQIPMVVIVILFGVENNLPVVPHDLQLWKLTTTLIVKFLSSPHGLPDCNMEELAKCSHILDLYKRSLSPETIHETNNNINAEECSTIILLSATYLSAAGIRFKPSPTRSVTDISFNRLFLKLPTIIFDHSFESEYLNLMSFEARCAGSCRQVTSYIAFMSALIRDASDVRLLRAKGVVKVALGSDQAVVDLLVSLTKDIALDPNSKLNLVKNQVIAYCEVPSTKYLVLLRRDYFSDPWASITVMYTAIGLYLAIIQTVFTVISAQKSK